MDLEHCRKDAKRLLHGVSAGDAGALARARQLLGDRAQQRFGLSDAQHVVASERGYRSWPALARAVRSAAEPGLAGAAPAPDRAESVIDTGLAYRPGDPVLVWVLRRGHRLSVSDHGTALRKAGRPPGWERACDRVLAELDVNISRAGVVSLPVVAVGPSEATVVARIGRASLSLFEELLELERP
ncbi:MAG TPA: hypothetical protein VGF68_13265 [Solirubrobacteraceae bacterium]